MTRLQDWPERLHEAIDMAKAKPFIWGEHDCTLFAADMVLAVTGIDYAADYRGTYHSAREAIALVESMGGLEVIADVGGQRIPVLMAGRGDIVMTSTSSGKALGVCEGANALFVTMPNGLVSMPMAVAELAWRV